MKRLAVFFPGIGYTADKPLLHYSRRLAEAQGYEIRLAAYGGFPKKVKGDPDKLRACCSFAYQQAKEQLSDLDLERCDDILFVGKSIGTQVAARIASRSPARGRIRFLFYTPLEETFAYPVERALVFTGSADPWVGEGRIPALCRAAGQPCRVIEQANHSLETGDPLTDIDNLRMIMRESAAFLAQKPGL